ncbi:hypothetical protein C8Q80DRAFT_1125365 [Daedaleopsis nitida]|nr:hypothetical protein C8Q80DRAFT_1125365 [Daedaleopsis nitida]
MSLLNFRYSGPGQYSPLKMGPRCSEPSTVGSLCYISNSISSASASESYTSPRAANRRCTLSRRGKRLIVRTGCRSSIPSPSCMRTVGLGPGLLESALGMWGGLRSGSVKDDGHFVPQDELLEMSTAEALESRGDVRPQVGAVESRPSSPPASKRILNNRQMPTVVRPSRVTRLALARTKRTALSGYGSSARQAWLMAVPVVGWEADLVGVRERELSEAEQDAGEVVHEPSVPACGSRGSASGRVGGGGIVPEGMDRVGAADGGVEKVVLRSGKREGLKEAEPARREPGAVHERAVEQGPVVLERPSGRR